MRGDIVEWGDRIMSVDDDLLVDREKSMCRVEIAVTGESEP